MSCVLCFNVYAIIGLFLSLFLVVLKLFVEITKGRCDSDTCLVGKTVLVTGGNSGLGYETALALAGRGARVIIADKNDSTESKRKIIEATGNENIVTKIFDLASFESVRKFAGEILSEESRLDILINNAGVGSIDAIKTTDGLPLLMQINYFGPFLLTHLLIDLLKKSTPSRIIFVSSLLCFTNNFALKHLTKFTKNRIFSYGNSKLCTVIASNTIAEKLKGTGVTCNSVHPGAVSTPIFTSSLTEQYDSILKELIYIGLKFVGKTPREGAQTQLYCALSKDLTSTTGKFFSDCRPFFQPRCTKNKQFCSDLWKKSEELVQLKDDEML